MRERRKGTVDSRSGENPTGDGAGIVVLGTEGDGLVPWGGGTVLGGGVDVRIIARPSQQALAVGSFGLCTFLAVPCDLGKVRGRARVRERADTESRGKWCLHWFDRSHVHGLGKRVHDLKRTRGDSFPSGEELASWPLLGDRGNRVNAHPFLGRGGRGWGGVVRAGVNSGGLQDGCVSPSTTPCPAPRPAGDRGGGSVIVFLLQAGVQLTCDSLMQWVVTHFLAVLGIKDFSLQNQIHHLGRQDRGLSPRVPSLGQAVGRAEFLSDLDLRRGERGGGYCLVAAAVEVAAHFLRQGGSLVSRAGSTYDDIWSQS